MQLFSRDLSKDIAIVAEVGVNHEGDPEAASRLLRLAAGAGADAVKFQSYSPSRYASASDPARLERVAQFSLDEATHRRLAREAEELGVPFFSTPLTEDAVPLLDEICPAFKVASGDLTFEPVIRAVAQTGKPVILSTGLGTVEEIDRAIDWLRDEMGQSGLAERLVIMHCVSAYPTPLGEANVLSVPFLSERYGVTVGYSNHVVEPEASLAAVAVGARVLEVHFTDCKTNRTFRDHELSFEPDEFENLIASARRVMAALGVVGKGPQPCERENAAAVRKGIVAARPLEAGTLLTREDLMFARPATEFRADELEEVIGSRLQRALAVGELVPRDALDRLSR